jgi:ribosomal protein S18 acetylase RimI-like enzyme
MSSPQVTRADLNQPRDLDDAVALFDAYRRFYGRDSDPAAARSFLSRRAELGESAVYLARDDAGRAVGFMQLYPSFSSTSLAPICILNDLFVAPEARRRGVGEALLAAAAAHGREVGAVRLGLSTAVTNHTAQALYEGQGWKRDTEFFSYTLPLPLALP